MTLQRFPLIAAATALLTIALIQPASSRPYPDVTGICYFFRGETRELTQTCIISGGYGAGAHYATLRWPDGVATSVVMSNNCEPEAYDEHGFCGYTVDDYEAEYYQRNVFFAVAVVNDADNLDCYRVVRTGNSVCYRVNQAPEPVSP